MHRIAEEGIAAHWRYKEKFRCQPARRAAVCLAPAAPGMAAGPARRQGVHGDGQGRSLPRRGICLHPPGRRKGTAPGVDAGGFRLQRPYRHRPPVRGRQGKRQDRAAQARAAQRGQDRSRHADRAIRPAGTGSNSSRHRRHGPGSRHGSRRKNGGAASCSARNCSKRTSGSTN